MLTGISLPAYIGNKKTVKVICCYCCCLLELIYQKVCTYCKTLDVCTSYLLCDISEV